MEQEKCRTTVNVPLERFKELEELEEAFLNGDSIVVRKKYDVRIDDFDTDYYVGEEAVYKIKQWLREEVKKLVKKIYKEDNPSLIKRVYKRLSEQITRIRNAHKIMNN